MFFFKNVFLKKRLQECVMTLTSMQESCLICNHLQSTCTIYSIQSKVFFWHDLLLKDDYLKCAYIISLLMMYIIQGVSDLFEISLQNHA